MEFKKANLLKRFGAGLIDGIISGLLGMVPLVGWLAAIAYSLAKDGLFEGASLGKKLLNLKVKTLEGEQGDYLVSSKRNLIFAIPSLFMIIPLLGMVIATPVALVIGIIEAIFIITDPLGRRLGDKFANSVVIEEE